MAVEYISFPSINTQYGGSGPAFYTTASIFA